MFPLTSLMKTHPNIHMYSGSLHHKACDESPPQFSNAFFLYKRSVAKELFHLLSSFLCHVETHFTNFKSYSYLELRVSEATP